MAGFLRSICGCIIFTYASCATLRHGVLSRRAPASSTGKVRLNVFYETMCPHCLNFMTQGLRPVWQDPELRAHVDLHLYPSGNAVAVPANNLSAGYSFWHRDNMDQNYVFLCQHGEAECLGNMIQACAVKELKEPSQYLSLIFCMSALPQFAVEKSSFECAKELKMDLTPVRACVQSPEGRAHMYQITTFSNTLNPPRQHVPWVTLDDEHFEEADTGDLLSPLCRKLSAPRPAACAKVSFSNVSAVIDDSGKVGGPSPFCGASAIGVGL